uniref:Secreted protein n=1 Tax=Prolemur simus TaxID=1328070 RepID=A0A8C8YK03_PROSS
MNYILYLCVLCLCMKAQSLEALPLVALVLSFCGVWFKDWFSKSRFRCVFHLAHWPASVNLQFRGTVLGSEIFLGVEENSADVQSWQKSVTLSCEGSRLCYTVAALEVCTVKSEKGKAKVVLVKYLLIVPYPLRLTFPSCPGANTGATP